uniref:DUF4347 domain-containing protein n=1 Tax=Accumulibacter sp. TaxID=2053492 RepID=UPI00262C865C
MATTQTTRELYVFDSAVPELQKLLAAVGADQRLLVLDAGSDGVLQLADALGGESSLDAIHIFSHGAVGSLWLGNTVLDRWNLPDYGVALAQIGSVLSESGDLLLYGCNVAQGDTGQAFIEQLAAATGADVAASTDLTGSAARGGNWVLEQSVGSVTAAAPAMASAYQGALLATFKQSAPYDLSTFASLAGLSDAAYQTGSQLEADVSALGWSLVDQELQTLSTPLLGINVVDAHAFRAERTVNGLKELVISFEGTNGTADIITDAIAWGFNEYYRVLRPTIESWIQDAVAHKNEYSKVFLTGHSLGGAAAQIAMLDMYSDDGLDIWSPLSPFSPMVPTPPLQADDRIAVSDRAWLQQHLYGATFGAPSISIDPPNLLLLQDTFELNMALGDLSAYKQRLFQFEHKYIGLDDPVASLGSPGITRGDELGTLVAIGVNGDVHDRYESFVGPASAVLGLDLHAIKGYRESLLRALTDSPLIGALSQIGYAGLDPLLPQVSLGTSTNDLIVDIANAQGFGGNDILVASVPSVLTMNGGLGSDTYVIKDYGLNVTIGGPANESADTLVFKLLGTVAIEEIGDTSDSLVFTITNGSTSQTSSVVVEKWFAATGRYVLADIVSVTPSEGAYWDSQSFSRSALGIPLLNNGTTASDTIVGSIGKDTMYGEAGDDHIRGRAGDDLVYAGDDADEVHGGPGLDTLKGEADNDTLYGDADRDTLYGDGGSDLLNGGTGVDVLFGGPGADTFQFDLNALPINPNVLEEIHDFNQGNTGSFDPAEGDRIDLSAIVGTAYAGGNGEPYDKLVKLTQVSVGGEVRTRLDVDADGGGSAFGWTPLAFLYGVAPGTPIAQLLDPASASPGAPDELVPVRSEPGSWSISPASQLRDEDGGSISFLVARLTTSQAETVYISTTVNQGSANNGDYDYWLNVPVTFAAGQSYFVVNIDINDDGSKERPETFGLIVQSSPAQAASEYLAQSTFSIIDDDLAGTNGVFTENGNLVWIEPTGGAETFDGLGGDDTAVVNLTGWAGGISTSTSGSTRTFSSGADSVSFVGVESLFVIAGTGNDSLTTGDGFDGLFGGAGADVLDGGGGIDLLDGGAGDDTFNNVGLGDIIAGGTGFDTVNVDLSAATEDITIDLGTGQGAGGTWTGVEFASGTLGSG